MDGSSQRSDSWVKGLHLLLEDDQSTIHFSDYAAITQTMLDGYVELVRKGKPDQAIALAMMGATLNFYEMFGMLEDLPDFLRSLADRIEDDSLPN